MSEIRVRRDGLSSLEAVSTENPFPVEVTDRIRTPRVIATDQVQIPGIGTASAYAALDAVGTRFPIPVPTSGTIVGARFYDLDDEGLGMKLWLFHHTFTQTADNSAFAPSDDDLLNLEAVVTFSNFHDGNTGQVATEDGLNIDYVAPEGYFWCQMQTLGAPNIAAGALPRVSLRIRPD